MKKSISLLVLLLCSTIYFIGFGDPPVDQHEPASVKRGVNPKKTWTPLITGKSYKMKLNVRNRDTLDFDVNKPAEFKGTEPGAAWATVSLAVDRVIFDKPVFTAIPPKVGKFYKPVFRGIYEAKGSGGKGGGDLRWVLPTEYEVQGPYGKLEEGGPYCPGCPFEIKGELRQTDGKLVVLYPNKKVRVFPVKEGEFSVGISGLEHKRPGGVEYKAALVTDDDVRLDDATYKISVEIIGVGKTRRRIVKLKNFEEMADKIANVFESKVPVISKIANIFKHDFRASTIEDTNSECCYGEVTYDTLVRSRGVINIPKVPVKSIEVSKDKAIEAFKKSAEAISKLVGYYNDLKGKAESGTDKVSEKDFKRLTKKYKLDEVDKVSERAEAFADAVLTAVQFKTADIQIFFAQSTMKTTAYAYTCPEEIDNRENPILTGRLPLVMTGRIGGTWTVLKKDILGINIDFQYVLSLEGFTTGTQGSQNPCFRNNRIHIFFSGKTEAVLDFITGVVDTAELHNNTRNPYDKIFDEYLHEDRCNNTCPEVANEKKYDDTGGSTP